MYAGLPVVTTSKRIPRPLNNAKYVVRADADDRPTFLSAISRLLTEPSCRSRIGMAAMERVANQYASSYLFGEVETEPEPYTARFGFRSRLKQIVFAAIPAAHLVLRGDPARSEVAITINDGPHPDYTPRILDIFAEFRVRATFFVVGNCAEQYPDIILRIAREGHQIGNHSYTHSRFRRLSIGEAVWELAATNAVIQSILGKPCGILRPPFGQVSWPSMCASLRLRERLILWSVDLKDYRATAAEELVRKSSETRWMNGDILLYHGNTRAALDALPSVIRELTKNGREAVRISDLTRS